MSEVSALSKAVIKAFPERKITDKSYAIYLNALVKLQSGMPVQYVLGKTQFYGLTFIVNSSVLIPRPETEELVEWVLTTIGNRERGAKYQQSSKHILDIGTGSGCIAISLKKNWPRFEVSAIDISQSALDVAAQNALLNKTHIRFIKKDILTIINSIDEEQSVLANREKLQIIVSNPPYVTPTDKEKMHRNVTAFEPHTALFVPEEDPLLFYRAIAGFCSC